MKFTDKLLLCLVLLFASFTTAPANPIFLLAGSQTAGADVTAPTLQTATVPSAGTSVSLTFSENVSLGAGGNGGWTISPSGGAATLTYSSGSGSGTLVYTTSRTINSGETATVAYTQPTNGVEDASGNDLATIASASVTNNSTQGGGGAPAYLGAYSVAANTGVNGLTINSVVVSGSDRCLIVVIDSWKASSPGVVSVVFNGSENLTRSSALSKTWEGSNGIHEVWYLLNPTVTTANITTTFQAGTDSCATAAIVLTGVNQTTPFGTGAETNATDTTISVSPATTTNDLVITTLAYYAAATYTPGTGITVPAGGTSENSGTESVKVGYKAGASTSTTTTFTSSVTSEMSLISFAVHGL